MSRGRRCRKRKYSWVANEQWHPEQRGETLEDGSFILEVPYSDDRELVMDIMKYGPDVDSNSRRQNSFGTMTIVVAPRWILRSPGVA